MKVDSDDNSDNGIEDAGEFKSKDEMDNFDHSIKGCSDDYSDNGLEDTVELKKKEFVEKDLKSEIKSDEDRC